MMAGYIEKSSYEADLGKYAFKQQHWLWEPSPSCYFLHIKKSVKIFQTYIFKTQFFGASFAFRIARSICLVLFYNDYVGDMNCPG